MLLISNNLWIDCLFTASPQKREGGLSRSPMMSGVWCEILGLRRTCLLLPLSITELSDPPPLTWIELTRFHDEPGKIEPMSYIYIKG